MQFLDLNEDCLRAVNCQILPEDLVNFVLSCRRLHILASTRLSEHRVLIAHYSVIDLNSYDGFAHDFGKPTLRIDHPMGLLQEIDQHPTRASYIRALYYCEWCDTSWMYSPPSSAPPNPHIAAREIAAANGNFEHILAALGIVKGAATMPIIDRDFCEVFIESLGEGDLMWTFALLLLHCRQLTHLKAIEHEQFHNPWLLEKILSTYEGMMTAPATPEDGTPAPSFATYQYPGVLPNLTNLLFAQGSGGTFAIQPCLRFFFTRPRIAHLQISGFANGWAPDIDVCRHKGQTSDETDPSWSDSPHPFRDFCQFIAKHPTFQTLDLRRNRDWDVKELRILIRALSPSNDYMAASKLRLIIYGNGYDEEWERYRTGTTVDANGVRQTLENIDRMHSFYPFTSDMHRVFRRDSERMLREGYWLVSRLMGDYPLEYFEIRRWDQDPAQEDAGGTKILGAQPNKKHLASPEKESATGSHFHSWVRRLWKRTMRWTVRMFRR